ncbi:Transcription initiation factor IIE subunit beta [Sparganum proliferum]
MDPALVKEREAFLRRARTMQYVETARVAQQSASSSLKSSSPSPSPAKRPAPNPAQRDYLTMDARPQNQGRFALLSKVVKYMKQRHLERDVHPLSVEEILEETMLQDSPLSDVKWLETEALPNNPKIHSTADGKFVFKPKYDVRNRQELYQLLKRHEFRGLGGIYLDDLAEAVADVDKVVQSLGDHVIHVVIPHDKKVVLFYNDKSFDLGIKEEFKQLWRAVSVEGMHEVKIEECLRRNGITSMSADRKIFTLATKQKQVGRKRASNRPVKLKDNEHLQDILKDFSQK